MIDENVKKAILAQSDWVMHARTLKEQCDIKLLILVSDYLEKQKSDAEAQIAKLQELIAFLEKMITKMLEESDK
jgi:hypothetical protein